MPQTHTQSPAVTGTSVLGVKFKNGVVIAADNLGVFGSHPALNLHFNFSRLTHFSSFIWFSGTIYGC